MKEHIFKKYIALGFSAKFILASLITSIGGAGYITVWSNYATYYYAWSHGFRIPAEGAPYLIASIGAISFIVLIVSLLVFLLVNLMGRLVRVYIKYNSESYTGTLARMLIKIGEELSWKQLIKASLIFGTLVAFFMGLASYYLERNSIMDSILYATILDILLVLIILILCKRRALIIISAAIAILFALSSPFILFNTSNYGYLLRFLGYGGGMQVRIIAPDSNKKIDVPLYLRTHVSLFIENESKQIVEYPISEIKYIEYVINPVIN